MTESRKAALARAAMATVEPLVELFLELGVTSPEAESLLRGVFVHTAHKWLSDRSENRESPSDVRVSLVTGVHRNFVKRILSEPPRIAAARDHRGLSASRLLEAWHSDPRYLDSSGKPRDLPERGGEPSFYSLVTSHVPGAAPGVVLDELRRAGHVKSLNDHRVRVRSRTIREHGINLESIGELSTRAADLLRTLRYNLRNPGSRLFCEGTPLFDVDATRLPALNNIVNRRASTFLGALQNEFAIEAEMSNAVTRRNRVKIGLTVFQIERT
jgi:hypothetical protein